MWAIRNDSNWTVTREQKTIYGEMESHAIGIRNIPIEEQGNAIIKIPNYN